MRDSDFARSYVDYLYTTRNKNAELIATMLRNLFVGFIVLSLPMFFTDHMPANFKSFQWPMIILMVIGFFGLMLEMIQYILTVAGTWDQLDKIEDLIFKSDEDKVNYKEIMEVDSAFARFNSPLFWARVGLSSVGSLIFSICIIVWASRI